MKVLQTAGPSCWQINISVSDKALTPQPSMVHSLWQALVEPTTPLANFSQCPIADKIGGRIRGERYIWREACQLGTSPSAYSRMAFHMDRGLASPKSLTQSRLRGFHGCLAEQMWAAGIIKLPPDEQVWTTSSEALVYSGLTRCRARVRCAHRRALLLHTSLRLLQKHPLL